LHDDDNPLEVDVLVVDEASMIDLVLFYSMLKALRSTTHLMLVGDIDQLPSVGAGNVLNDIIASGVAHVTRLNQIFRQDDDSHIILNAHRINEGQQPFTDNKSRDFFFFGANSAEDAQALTVDVVVNRIPDKFGYDPVHDVQVLSPMYRNMGGVNMLNQALQERLNPDRMQMFKKLAGRIFRVGDKVMQTKKQL
jgi:exodeoxyribonuclease V alpha subunit